MRLGLTCRAWIRAKIRPADFFTSDEINRIDGVFGGFFLWQQWEEKDRANQRGVKNKGEDKPAGKLFIGLKREHGAVRQANARFGCFSGHQT